MAFQYYKSFKMDNLPEIRTIDIGNGCFGSSWCDNWNDCNGLEVSLTGSVHKK